MKEKHLADTLHLINLVFSGVSDSITAWESVLEDIYSLFL